jgi:N-acetylglucosamine-6-sulfatase
MPHLRKNVPTVGIVLSRRLPRNLLTAVLLCLFVGMAAETQPSTQKDPQRPNVLFILTDDQDPGSLRNMANVQSLLVDQGTNFTHAYATTPQCCPSRVSFMRGQYVHNHGVLENKPPEGGYQKFRELDLQRSTIATWLDETGYDTFYAGKFMNAYRYTRYVPPGWDEWYAFGGGELSVDQNYTVNENGTLRTYTQDQQHETYYLRDKAETFIRSHARGAPWFAWVSTHTPHWPHTIAPEFLHSYDNAKMPRPPSYNEADVRDRPAWIQKVPRVDFDCSTEDRNLDCHREVVQEWRARQEALKSVDVMVKDLITTLNETNQSRRTYVVFASDNGYLLYRHRVYGKGGPYEESQGVPFVVRGPGVPRAVSNKLVANIDLAPTIAAWTGVQPPKYVSGRSLVPIFDSGATSWRRYLLFEFFLGDRGYAGVRTAGGETYVEYGTGEKEYYELGTDPWQVESAHRAPQNAKRLKELSTILSNLKGCKDANCRLADGGP